MDSKPNNRGFFARSKYQHKKCAVITVITVGDTYTHRRSGRGFPC